VQFTAKQNPGASSQLLVILPPSYDSDKTRTYPCCIFSTDLATTNNVHPHRRFPIWGDLWERGQLGEFLIATQMRALRFTSIRATASPVRKFSGAGIFAGSKRAIARNRVGPTAPSQEFPWAGYGALHWRFVIRTFFAVSAHSAAIIDKLPAFTAPTSGAASARAFSAEFLALARSRFLGPQ